MGGGERARTPGFGSMWLRSCDLTYKGFVQMKPEPITPQGSYCFPTLRGETASTVTQRAACGHEGLTHPDGGARALQKQPAACEPGQRFPNGTHLSLVAAAFATAAWGGGGTSPSDGHTPACRPEGASVPVPATVQRLPGNSPPRPPARIRLVGGCRRWAPFPELMGVFVSSRFPPTQTGVRRRPRHGGLSPRGGGAHGGSRDGGEEGRAPAGPLEADQTRSPPVCPGLSSFSRLLQRGRAPHIPGNRF